MPKYNYKAKDDFGKTIKGSLTADNETELASLLEAKGFYLTGSSIKTEGSLNISFGGGVKQKELLEFTTQLSMIADAGVPIISGIEDVITQSDNLYFKKVLISVKDDISGGESLSASMGKFPKVFPNLYISMIKGGEATGELGQAMDSLSGFLEWQIDLKGSIKSATLMPAITFGVMIAVIALLLTFVFPTFAKLFKSMHIELPGITVFFISLSDFLRFKWYLLLGGIIGIIGTFKAIRSFPAGKYAIDKCKLFIPVIGDLMRKIAIYRFSKIFSILFACGVEITSILLIMEDVMGNAVLETVVKAARENIMTGLSLTDSFAESGEFPPLIVRMISVGENTGTLDVTLGKVAKFYDRDIPITIEKVIAYLQPMLIFILAGMVLCIALAIFLPMYEMTSVVKK